MLDFHKSNFYKSGKLDVANMKKKGDSWGNARAKSLVLWESGEPPTSEGYCRTFEGKRKTINGMYHLL